jgi:hypothetical protein
LHSFGESSWLRTSGTIDRGYGVSLASHFSEEWALLHSRGFHCIPELWDKRHGFMGFSDIAKAFPRVARIASLLSYSSSAAQSTWLAKRSFKTACSWRLHWGALNPHKPNVLPQKFIHLPVSRDILHRIFASLHQFLTQTTAAYVNCLCNGQLAASKTPAKQRQLIP